MRGIDLIQTWRAKLEQDCPKCDEAVLALRINGFYAGSRDRIFLWECPLCGGIWRKARARLKTEPLLLDGE